LEKEENNDGATPAPLVANAMMGEGSATMRDQCSNEY
jgi:hypothetical protein